MIHLKIYENWSDDNELINYADILYEYQGYYFLRVDGKYKSVRFIPEFASKNVADEIYKRVTGKSIDMFDRKNVSDEDIELFADEINKLKRNHKLIILTYIFDKYYSFSGRVEYLETFFSKFEDLFDDINDTSHPSMGILGDTIDDAVMAIDKHFMGDEINKYNL
jgi:hypothetical protein